MLNALLLKELRCLYRDRQVLVYSLLLPLFLYPLLWFGVTQIKVLVEGLEEHRELRVALVGLGQQEELARILERMDAIALEFRDKPQDKRLAKGGVEAALLRTERGLRLGYDSRHSASRQAKDRLSPVLEAWRSEGERRIALAAGFAEHELRATPIETLDLSRGEVLGERILALLLPLVLLVMTTFGASYPALELTTGEREHRTAETTGLLPIGRRQLALAKLLAVSLCTFQALLANLLAIALTVGPMFLAMGEGIGSLPMSFLASLPVVLGFGMLLSIVFASLFLLAGSHARSYREAQAYVTPLQILALAPGLSTLVTPVDAPLWTALIPVYNVGQAFRMSLLGQPSPFYLMVTFSTLTLFALLCFRSAVNRLSSTEFLLGFSDPDAGRTA